MNTNFGGAQNYDKKMFFTDLKAYEAEMCLELVLIYIKFMTASKEAADFHQSESKLQTSKFTNICLRSHSTVL